MDDCVVLIAQNSLHFVPVERSRTFFTRNRTAAQLSAGLFTAAHAPTRAHVSVYLNTRHWSCERQLFTKCLISDAHFPTYSLFMACYFIMVTVSDVIVLDYTALYRYITTKHVLWLSLQDCFNASMIFPDSPIILEKRKKKPSTEARYNMMQRTGR